MASSQDSSGETGGPLIILGVRSPRERPRFRAIRSRRIGIVGAILTGWVVLGSSVGLGDRGRDVPVYRLRGAFHRSLSSQRSFCGNAGVGATPPALPLFERVRNSYHEGAARLLGSIADWRGEPPIELNKLKEYRGRW
jgi:hypothetical protein